MSDLIHRNIMEIDIRIKETSSLSWLCYSFAFSAEELVIETLAGVNEWKLIDNRSFGLELAKKLRNDIESLDIEEWPERFIKIFITDSDKWIIDISYTDDTYVSVSGSRESSSNWGNLLSILSSYDIKIEDCLVSKSTTIIPFPDHEKLKKEVEKLRIGLSMLVLERDHLAYIECKNIEMVYMLNLGGLEYRAFEIECAVRRLKRKIELIQAKKNRQEKVVLSDIEEILDTEFTEFQAKLDAKIGKMNAALDRSKGKELTKSESSELKKLYRGIVKALHPDLHPGNSKEKIQLFLNAVEAYKNCDLTGLRVISEMYIDQKIPEDHKDALALLVKEKERLTDLIKKVKTSITKMKSAYPYTMKSLVQDPDKISAKKKELEGIIEEGNKIIDLFQSKLTDMMR